jgi:dipeptidyl aminopeptidase/acylaminoacyl peptidase
MKFSRLFQVLLLTAFSITITIGNAQISPARYAKADSVREFGKLVYHAFVNPHWIEDTSSFWYEVATRKGKEYFLVDAAGQKKSPAFDLIRLADSINLQTGESYQPYELPIDNLEFSKALDEITFTISKAKWRCRLKDYRISKIEDIREDQQERRYWGAGRDELGNDPVTSPDSTRIAYVQGYNVFVKSADDEEVIQLSYDGNESEFYSSYIEWSPDSKKLATFKVRSIDRRIIQFIESSPPDRLQPRLHQRPYLKPGDVVPVRKPALFDVATGKQIPIETQPFLSQYSLNRLDWREDSRAFTFEFNKRGHQVYLVVEVDANSGKTRIIIDERSETFIDYSSKRYRYDVEDGEEIIWASERDGWNHLYLYNGRTGEVKNQITKGEWVVRGVNYVDEDTRQITFRASGKNQGEDPYLIHYYRINFDGAGLVDLTPERANHRATFSTDHKYFVDNYSRVDDPPITVLRNGADGKVLMTLEKADISDLLAKGWQFPEVFIAKGRDGVTDIWGNIYRPTHFDPDKSYPVIEYIYAGPHSSFAQKSFRPLSRAFSSLAELGFVIVQLDGMGTSNRSKAFHNVCWKNLKDAGFPDRKLWIRAAAQKYPYLDISKVGIFGTSAGGQSAMAALLWHSDLYKVAVSSSGCHDNRMDKIWWNEQWMGYPVGKHYEENSNVVNAHLLEGQLMLIVGELDDNVDPASTMQVADALIKANKEFELVVLPGVNHTLGGEYGERKRRDFFVKYILGMNPPNWNQIDSKAEIGNRKSETATH